MKYRINWTPQPRQLKFLNACGLAKPFMDNPNEHAIAKVIGYGGSAGGGKSDALLGMSIVAAFMYPNINIAYFRRTYPELEGVGGAIMRSQQLLSGIAKWNGSLRRWTFPTGAILQFCHCNDENDVYQYQSQQIDILLFDEGTHFLRTQYRYLMTRNRATVPNFKPFCAIGTNPGGIGHSWFKSEFVDAGEPEKVHDVEVEPFVYEKHIFIPAKLSDNMILENRDPNYRKTLEAQPDEIRKQLLDGDWDTFSGQFFKEFRRHKHVVSPFSIPKNWKRFVSMDWGYNDPCAIYWHVVGPDRHIYTYRELYIRETPASEIAKKIKELSEGEDISYHVGSPDIWARRGNDSVHGESIGETMLKHGVSFVKADNDRINGWTRMREYLMDSPDGSPYWQIFESCTNLIRTLPALIYNTSTSRGKAEDVDDTCEDHAPESCRYGLMSRPRPNDIMPIQVPKELPPDLRADLEEDPEALKHYLSTLR